MRLLSKRGKIIVRTRYSQVFTIANKCETKYGSRSLTPEEKEILQRIFGDSIEYNKIILNHKKGTGRANTDGKTITMYDEYKDPTGKKEKHFENGVLTSEGKEALVHEAMHIWQFEKLGYDSSWINNLLAGEKMGYLLAWAKFKDLPNYIKAWLDFNPNTVPGESLYEWRDKADAKPPVRFEDLDPEEQARLVEEYYKTYQYDIYKTFIYTQYVNDAIQYIRLKEKGGSKQRG